MNVSMHFGVNKYDPKVYGTGADLRGCVADASNMYQLAKDLGYQERWLLTDEKVTRAAFKDMIEQAVKMTAPGDTVLISYSCHGTQVLDHNHDEADKLDEALCLHDGLLYDDQFAALLAKFKGDIDINIVSDTCHSEGQIRNLIGAYPKYLGVPNPQKKESLARIMPQASVLQFAACRSTEVAWDEGDGGAFTKAVMKHALGDRKRKPASFIDTVKRSVARQTPILHFNAATRPHRTRTALFPR